MFKNQFFTLIQIIVSIFILVEINSIQILPNHYFVLLTLLLLLATVLVYFLQFHTKRTSFRSIFAKLLVCIICGSLAYGYGEIKKGERFVNSFTEKNLLTDAMSVIVLKDSPYETMDDLNNSKLGINPSVDIENGNTTLQKIKEEIDVEAIGITEWELLVQSLQQDSIQAIIVNEAYRGFLEQVEELFSEQTRVIQQYELTSEVENEANYGAVNNGIFNIYLTGIDTYGPINTKSRSDMNMIMSVNMNTHHIILTSVPRDYYVPLAMNGQYDKLTHSGLYGVNETIHTVENFLGVEMDYHYRVNFNSLINMVDLIGGIDVYSDRDMDEAYQQDCRSMKEGMNHIDGKTALAYSRERYSYEDGDNHRIKNQQDVLIAIINQLLKTENIMNYQALLQGVEGSFESNMTSEEIYTIIRNQLSNMKGYTFTQQFLTGTGQMVTGHYSLPNMVLYSTLPDQSSIEACRNAIIELQNEK